MSFKPFAYIALKTWIFQGFTLVSFRGQNVAEEKFYSYLLGFVMKISDRHPTTFILGEPPGCSRLCHAVIKVQNQNFWVLAETDFSAETINKIRVNLFNLCSTKRAKLIFQSMGFDQSSVLTSLLLRKERTCEFSFKIS